MRVEIGDGWVEAHPHGKELNNFKVFFTPIPENPVEPRLASTVMLLRDSVAGNQTENRIADNDFPTEFPPEQNVEVFMLRRQKTMDFMPDAVVFPGGRVDERDANPSLPWCGPNPASWAQQMVISEEVARKVVVAAAREVFEECGVLLAGPDAQHTTDDLSDPKWAQARAALEHHEISFAEFLMREGLVLRSDLLCLVSNWCTPPYVPKRFDTFFFAALLPAGQQPDGKTSEAQVAGWVTPAYAIRQADRGEWLVVGPTTFNLERLAEAKDAASYVADTKMFPGKVMAKGYHDPDGTPHVRWER